MTTPFHTFDKGLCVCQLKQLHVSEEFTSAIKILEVEVMHLFHEEQYVCLSHVFSQTEPLLLQTGPKINYDHANMKKLCELLLVGAISFCLVGRYDKTKKWNEELLSHFYERCVEKRQFC